MDMVCDIWLYDVSMVYVYVFIIGYNWNFFGFYVKNLFKLIYMF